MPTRTDPTGEAPIPLSAAGVAPKHVYKSLDAWRGFAALWVVASHATGFALFAHADALSNPVTKLLAQGYLGVELFFVISGYCIAAALVSAMKKPAPVREFAEARVRRIYPPYLAAFVLLLVMAWAWRAAHPAALFGGEMNGATSAQAGGVYLGNALLAQSLLRQTSLLPVAWTLGYEVGFYAICGAAIALLRRRGADAALTLLHGLTLLTAAAFAAGFCGKFGYPLDMWAFFGAGALLFDTLRRTDRVRHGAGLAIVCALLAAGAIFHPALAVGLLHHEPRRAVGAVVATVALMYVLHRWDDALARNPAVKTLGFFGVFSYSLYLVHYYIIAFAVVVFLPFFAAMPTAIVVAALFCLAVAAGYLFFRVVEQPFLKAKARRIEATPAAHAIRADAAPSA